MSEPVIPVTRGGVGESVPRPDGPGKVRGEYLFASDLSAPGMLHGRTLRSPHPHAEILSIDTRAAAAMPGVAAVLTAADVPGEPRYGLERADQPVLAHQVVRFRGEPVALVAAEHPEQARAALAVIRVEYRPLPAVTDPLTALDSGEVFRELSIRHGRPERDAHAVVEGYYEVGQQDQAPLGPEAGLAIPDREGGVDLHVATQAIHYDLHQVAACLGLPAARVRIHSAGVGGAFGAREDLSVHVHACMLALATGRPVKMVYGREESFVGHVHRHPARLWYRHGARRDGTLAFVDATIVLDGGAYLSSSNAVVLVAASFSAGPYRVPAARIWCAAARTNNVPSGAMRGFGAVQVCFAHEAQMDRLAAQLGMHPLAIRRLNALRPGDRMITGQQVVGAAPVEELIHRLESLPPPVIHPDPLARPGGAGAVAEPGTTRVGTGYALGYKNVGYSEGFDDYSTARVRVERRGDRPVALVSHAGAEVGQGLVTVTCQIVRTELGIERVELLPASTAGIGSAGSSSASRQTWMTGRAVKDAAARVARALLERAGPDAAALAGEHVVDVEGVALMRIVDLLDEPVEAEVEYHHRPTAGLDPDGQGSAHLAFMFVAQRATVELDAGAGLARVVEVATAQEVGRAINPIQVHGQVEGGVAQGVGLALMEEIVSEAGRIRNASFTDYLLPTVLDMPAISTTLVEEPEPDAPYGAKGVGEPPLVASPAAVAAALRDASGRRLGRIPVRPDHLVGLSEGAPDRWLEPGRPWPRSA